MFAYLRRPYFPAGQDRVGEAQLKHLVQLLFFSIALMIIVVGIVGSISTNVSGDIPENINETVGKDSLIDLLLWGVILAPIVEEVIFRSWLGGRRACILGLPILVSLFAVATAASAKVSPPIIIAIVAGLTAFVVALARQLAVLTPEGQKDARWRLFPFAFYGSAVLFAVIHLSNYEGGLSSPIMLLAVLPQALVGLVLGYVRMRFGLPQAIIFHALYNLVLIGVFLMAQTMTPAAESAAIIAHPLALTLVVGGAPT
jgi:membrane protease YdiL (CAAX protease family)